MFRKSNGVHSLLIGVFPVIFSFGVIFMGFAWVILNLFGTPKYSKKFNFADHVGILSGVCGIGCLFVSAIIFFIRYLP